VRRIFLSYGHDRYADFAELLKRRLQDRGHKVWFDVDRMKAGVDWELYIDQGLAWAAEPAATAHDATLRPTAGRVLPKRTGQTNIQTDIRHSGDASLLRAPAVDRPNPAARHGGMRGRGPNDALENNNLDSQGLDSTLLKCLAPPDFSADIRDHLQEFEQALERLLERLRTASADLPTPGAPTIQRRREAFGSSIQFRTRSNAHSRPTADCPTCARRRRVSRRPGSVPSWVYKPPVERRPWKVNSGQIAPFWCPRQSR
jgi:hypothetical protein